MDITDQYTWLEKNLRSHDFLNEEEIPALDKNILKSVENMISDHAPTNAMRKKPLKMGRLGSRAAFTLVELLVVISIISVLAAMLLPVLNTAMSHSRSIICINNLKQLGLVFLSYADDNNGKMVYADSDVGITWQLPYLSNSSWSYPAGGYIENNEMLYCPESEKRGLNYTYGCFRTGTSAVTDSMKWTYSKFGYSGTFMLLDLNSAISPSSTVIAGDAVQWWGSYKGPYWRLYKDGAGIAHLDNNSGMLCIDGHSAMLSSEKLVTDEYAYYHYRHLNSGNRVRFSAGYDVKTGERIF